MKCDLPIPCDPEKCHRCSEGRFWHCVTCHGCEYCCDHDENGQKIVNLADKIIQDFWRKVLP